MTSHHRNAVAAAVVIADLSALAVAVALAVAPGIALAQAALPQPTPVRVWQDTMTILTYEEAPPDPNPPFDLFAGGRINYPYTLLTNLTDRRVPHVWRTLNLENEYLRCIVLPDLGGHLYRCTDKVNGREMFYANPSIKYARIAYRGAWVALGIEFNFPVSHNWMTTSPVDYATGTNEDGSAWVQVANTDRVTGMRWQVTLTLQPGRAVLEQRTTLSNASDVRHRFYWWTNAGVQVWDDSRILYPMKYTAGHGFADIDTWPVNGAGLDLSVLRNHTAGAVSRFAYGSREPFMAVYHPRTHAGVVHYSSPTDLPGKKIWSWGVTPDGIGWRYVLSDDSSAYVEIQAGLFRDQETYGFLDPEEAVTFREYWLPIRDLGALVRANTDAALSLSRTADGTALDIALNVTRALPGASITVTQGARDIATERVSLTPAETFTRHLAGLAPGDTAVFTLRDAAGAVVLQHAEGRYDFVPDSEIKTGRIAPYEVPPPAARSDGEAAAVGEEQESQGQMLDALATYREGLRRFPQSLALNRDAGRLEVGMKQPASASDHLAYALARVSTDREAWYYAGLAALARGLDAAARRDLEQAQSYGTFRVPATIELAAIAARAGRRAEALALLERVAREPRRPVRAGALQVMLLRSLGRNDEARTRLAGWLAEDPDNSFLRYEGARLGSDDAALWTHLAADPERILDVATEYIRFGLYADALEILSRTWPNGGDVVTEPGMPRPEAYPLIAYYRGWVRFALGQDGRADFAAASRMPTTYVFPSRPETFDVLRRALAALPGDATAHFLLGSLLMSAGLPDSAMAEWNAAARLNPRIPTLHRNLAMTVLKTGGSVDSAIALFLAGTRVDPLNDEPYLDLEAAMRQAGRPAEERARALLAYPGGRTIPPVLAFTTARTLAEAGRFDDAEKQLAGRYFSREEGGEDYGQVYLELRTTRARSLATHGQCAQALRVLDHLGDPRGDLQLTRDRLRPLVESSAVRDGANAVRAACRAHD